jgi:hypothetical protein
MSRWSHSARVAAVFLLWCVLSGVVGAWGWQFAAERGPVPPGCGCFNAAAIPLVVGWAFLGAVAGVAVVSAVMGAAGLGLYVRARRRGADPDPAHDDAVASDLDAWLSAVAERDAHVPAGQGGDDSEVPRRLGMSAPRG